MFSIECFIRKNTPELREKLENLGVYMCICTGFDGWDWLSYSEDTCHGFPEFDEVGGNVRQYFLNNLTNEIDCGENEELFIRLTTLDFTDDESDNLLKLNYCLHEFGFEKVKNNKN